MPKWIKKLNLKHTSEQPDMGPVEHSDWKLIFSLSKVNGAPYDGDQLPANPWSWPKFTAFQQRLQFVRRQRQWDRDSI
jgi:hypothetical protein